MDTVWDCPWTTETCLRSGNQRDCAHEFDAERVVPATGGNVAYQRIMGNPSTALRQLHARSACVAVPAMRLQTGSLGRYPDIGLALPDRSGALARQTVCQGLTFAA
jgi:hypothetical protein